MRHFSELWENFDKPTMKRTDRVSQWLLDTNETFRTFINSGSWLIYVIASVLILFCVYYYIYECRRRLDLKRRRQQAQRATERQPQRRRPGAVYRDHEIFRNVIKTVRQYIGPPPGNKDNDKPYVLRRTRSGAIYGRFDDREATNAQ